MGQRSHHLGLREAIGLRGSNSDTEIFTRPAILISHTKLHPSDTRTPMRNRRRGLRLRPQVDLLDERCLLSGLTPAQVTAAYGLNAIDFTTSTGNGEGKWIGRDHRLDRSLQRPHDRLRPAYF